MKIQNYHMINSNDNHDHDQNYSFFFSYVNYRLTEVRGLSNFKLVQEAHEQTQQALLEYTINCYPQITVR